MIRRAAASALLLASVSTGAAAQSYLRSDPVTYRNLTPSETEEVRAHCDEHKGDPQRAAKICPEMTGPVMRMDCYKACALAAGNMRICDRIQGSGPQLQLCVKESLEAMSSEEDMRKACARLKTKETRQWCRFYLPSAAVAASSRSAADGEAFGFFYLGATSRPALEVGLLYAHVEKGGFLTGGAQSIAVGMSLAEDPGLFVHARFDQNVLAGPRFLFGAARTQTGPEALVGFGIGVVSVYLQARAVHAIGTEKTSYELALSI